MKNKHLLIITCITFILFSINASENRLSAFTCPELCECYNAPWELELTIRLFERFINSNDMLSYDDTLYFFGPPDENIENFFIRCDCIKDNIKEEDCFDYTFNRFKNYKGEYPALLFTFLRSDEGPIFEKGDKIRKIKIIVQNKKIHKKAYTLYNKSYYEEYIIIDTKINIIGTKRSVNAVFIGPRNCAVSKFDGKFTTIMFEGKSIYDLYGPEECKKADHYRKFDYP